MISHLDPKHSSMMTELISRFTAMTVHEATDGVVQPDHVYVIPPNRDLSIFHGRLQLTEQDKSPGTRMPIELFLRSLAEDQGDRAVAVILSGTGSDGTLGLRAVQGSGGVVFVQDPASMPSMTACRGAQYGPAWPTTYCPSKRDPGQLTTPSRKVSRKEEPPEEKRSRGHPEDTHGGKVEDGARLLAYKKNTVLRRIQRRISVHNLEDAAAYLRYLAGTPGRGAAALQGDAHQRDELLPRAGSLRGASRDGPPRASRKTSLSDYTIRVWVPGCATGEEAYSIAMVIREYAEETRRDYRVQMFATDIDEDSIRQARTGFFPPNIALDVPAPRLAKFFIKEETGYRVRKDIREMIVFAPAERDEGRALHQARSRLLPERPYLHGAGAPEQASHPLPLQPQAGRRALPRLFRDHRCPDGPFQHHRQEMEVLPGQADNGPRSTLIRAGSPSLAVEVTEAEESVPRPRKKDRPRGDGTRTLLSAFAPPAVIVNEKGKYSTSTVIRRKYLTPAPGRPTFNIADMAREGLRFHMRTALLAAATPPAGGGLPGHQRQDERQRRKRSTSP